MRESLEGWREKIEVTFRGIPLGMRLELLLILILGAVAFTWVDQGLVVKWFDSGYSLDPSQTFYDSFSLWNNRASIGITMPGDSAGILPNNLGFFVLNSLGVTLTTAQSLFFYLILVGSGISMYFLTMQCATNPRQRKGALFASILYMFSPVAAMFIWNQFASNYYSYCFIPLILGLIIWSIRRGGKWSMMFLIAMIWTLLITTSYIKPVNCIVDWALVLGLFIFLYLMYPERRSTIPFSLSILLFSWVILNLFWLAPNLLYFQQEFNRAGVNILGFTNVDMLRSNSVPMGKAFLQTGYWGLFGTYQGDHWYTWWQLASSTLYSVALFAISALSFVSIAFRRNGYALFFGLVAIISIFMIGLGQPPFDQFFIGLFDEYPLLQSFRSLYQMFGIPLTLSISFLFGFASSLIIGRLFPEGISNIRNIRNIPPWLRSNAIGALLIVIVILMPISVMAYPYATGEVIYRGGNVIPSAQVDVPEEYQELSDWLNGQEGQFSLLSLPYSKIGYGCYDWDYGYWADDPQKFLFDQTVLTNEYFEANSILMDISYALGNGVFEMDPAKVLSIFNVRYIILHQDANWEFIQDFYWWVSPTSTFDDYEASLEMAGFEKMVVFGPLTVFENPEWTNSLYYSTDGLIEIVENGNALNRLSQEYWYDPGQMPFVNDQSLTQAAKELVTGIYLPELDMATMAYLTLREEIGAYQFGEEIEVEAAGYDWVRMAFDVNCEESDRYLILTQMTVLEDTEIMVRVDGVEQIPVTYVNENSLTSSNTLNIGAIELTEGSSTIEVFFSSPHLFPGEFLLATEKMWDNAIEEVASHYFAPTSQSFSVPFEICVGPECDSDPIVYDSLIVLPSSTFSNEQSVNFMIHTSGQSLRVDYLATIDSNGNADQVLLNSHDYCEDPIVMGPNQTLLVTLGTDDPFLQLHTSFGEVFVKLWESYEDRPLGSYQLSLHGGIHLESGPYDISVTCLQELNASSIILGVSGDSYSPSYIENCSGAFILHFSDIQMADGLNNVSLMSTGTLLLGDFIRTIEFTQQGWSVPIQSWVVEVVSSSTDQRSIEIEDGSILVFTERYDEGWMLDQQDATSAHFKVNELFNGYLVQSGVANLNFATQKVLTYSMLASISFAFIGIAVVVFLRLRRAK